MKRVPLRLLATLLSGSRAEAKLNILGTGDAPQFDVSTYPPGMRQADQVMVVKCVTCHPLERTANALGTGIAPITGGIFDRGAALAYGIRLLRQPDAKMNKADVKVVIELLNFMREEAIP